MSDREPRLRTAATCQPGGPAKPASRAHHSLRDPHTSHEPPAVGSDSRRLWPHYLREHANTVALAGVVAVIVLPPTVAIPMSGLELILTLVVTLAAVLLAGAIGHEARRR